MPQPSPRLVTAISLSVAALTFALFWPVTRCDFINLDDPGYFFTNPYVLGGLKWENVLWAFQTEFLGNWHPLTWLSLMLDAELFGPGPRGPHWVSLLLHAANALLVFLLLHRMTGALWRSAVAALLFALHPLRVESVAWVSERKDVLSGLFFLLTLWAYVRYAAARKQNPESRITGHASGVHLPSSILYLLSLSFFALGLMAKPMLVTVPFVLLLLDYWPLQRLTLSAQDSRRKSLLPLFLEKAPFLLLSGVFCWLTFQAQHRAGAVVSTISLPLAARLENALVSYARYLGKTFWPMDLAVCYPHPGHWPLAAVAAATALVVALSLGALWYGRQRPYLLTGWYWWFGTLIPVIGLTQVGAQAMADRYTYLPAIGLCVVLVWGASECAKSVRLPHLLSTAGGLALLVSCGLRTADQLRYWKDSETLFRHSLACAPGSLATHDCLGLALAHKGQWADAIANYQQALALQPTARSPRNNLAWLLATCPQAEFRNGTKAVELARELNRLSGGNDRDSLDTLAAAYAEAGQFPQAVEAAERAVASAVAQGNPQAEQFRARLKLYQQGLPYHEPAPLKP